MLRTRFLVTTILGAASLCWIAVHPSVAATASALPPPDLSGIYGFIFPFLPDVKAQMEGMEPLNPNLGEVAEAHLLPWARALMLASAPYSAIDDNAAICGPNGIFSRPAGAAGYMVLQRPQKIILVSTDLAQVGVRRIYLTDHHPRNLLPTWNGHSIGHWEGDTLVVDTIGFNDKSWLESELQPHTEELHVVERMRLVKDGRLLEIHSTVDDRKALSGPYSYSRYYRRTHERYEALTLACNPNPGDQETWYYMQRQAIQQFELNRQRSK